MIPNHAPPDRAAHRLAVALLEKVTQPNLNAQGSKYRFIVKVQDIGTYRYLRFGWSEVLRLFHTGDIVTNSQKDLTQTAVPLREPI